MSNTFLTKLKGYFTSYFTLSDYMVPQEEAEQEIREGISFRGTNIVILVIAILIASLGLNTNSTAVIIGAMLISPLMGPIIGLGLGVGIQDFNLLKRSLRNLAMAAGFSVIASTLYFMISPVGEGHSELLARTSPTIYDVLIGFFGGAAGIVAIGSRSKGNVIPGVAIATALMPPLCTAGYGLATLQATYFFGAFYLFLINSIFIALSTFIGVKLMNYRPATAANPERARKVRRLIYTIAILAILPSIYLTYTMLRDSRFAMNASRFVNTECNIPGTHVLSYSTSINRGERSINVTLIGRPLPEDSLKLALSSRLKFYNLAGTTLNIIQGAGMQDRVDINDLSRSSMRDIYELAQASISAKQTTIDSLRAIIAYRRSDDSMSLRIAPEIKVLFPEVKDIAISRAVFNRIGTAQLDTTHVALVAFTRTFKKSAEMQRYLQARLNIKHISIVQVPATTAEP